MIPKMKVKIKHLKDLFKRCEEFPICAAIKYSKF